jgi:drug/metabolite transporter (DMT)-like permease
MFLANLDSLTLNSPLLWLPLLAAVLFSTGGLLLKRSAGYQVGIWRTTFISNLSTCTAIIPTFILGGNIPEWHYFWQPVVMGLIFVIGQMTTIIALTKGEVSIAGPILGLKIVLVAFFSTFMFAKPLPLNIWLACFLATLGIALLNMTEAKGTRKSVLLSILCAFIAAASYGLLDVLLQSWSGHWGIGRLLPLSFICGALLTLLFIPLFEGQLVKVPQGAWFWLLLGSGIIAINSLIIVCTIFYYGNAPTVNVLYSTRGLFGIILVVMIGKYIGVTDQTLYGKTFWYRITGAILICVSIYQLM